MCTNLSSMNFFKSRGATRQASLSHDVFWEHHCHVFRLLRSVAGLLNSLSLLVQRGLPKFYRKKFSSVRKQYLGHVLKSSLPWKLITEQFKSRFIFLSHCTPFLLVLSPQPREGRIVRMVIVAIKLLWGIASRDVYSPNVSSFTHTWLFL